MEHEANTLNPWEATTLKAALATFQQAQQAAFATQPIADLLRERSGFYDRLLWQLWQQFELDQETDLALLAVGGYGREEMFPLSDLDILVISRTPPQAAVAQRLNALFNLLWDSRFQLGASIRTLTECVAVGRSELSVATNMLESRFLFGQKMLWTDLMTQLYQPDFWALPDFYRAKMAEHAERYARYHHTSYNLEPDLKHSPGGLRDLHLLSWIMLRHAKISRLDELNTRGLLYDEEYHELLAAQETLFRMRFALHLQLKRYDNRLRFDRQLQLSAQLGYQGEGNQPVEAMMKHFFQATQSISQLTQLVLADFAQTVLSPLQKKAEKQPLDADFYRQHDVIACADPSCFYTKPYRILDLFYYLTEQPDTNADTQTLRQLRLALQHLDRPLCNDPQARARFLRLLQQPNVVNRAIVPLHRLGGLTAYLPQWHHIAGLMQFDLFHIYTVDEHTVRVMLHLERFLHPETQAAFPLCCHLFTQLEKRHLIYLAALFHDIAKGRDGEHAKEGAEDMRQFAALHGFSEEEGEYMAWLVESHLTMSITAQRRDIHDPLVIQQFAQQVATPTRLAALTCLTVADIYGTHETLWNDWKRSLFRQLYQSTLEQLERGEDHAYNRQKQADEQRQAALDQIKFLLHATDQQRLNAFWHACPTDYFVRNMPTQLVWHALNYLKQPSLPMVLISNQYARGATEIFIHCHDRPQLFARIAHTLSCKKISIHDAQIITGDQGIVLDSFIVTEQNGKALSQARMSELQQRLRQTLLSKQAVPPDVARSPHALSFKQETRVRFLAGEGHTTAFELFTLDRDGLLAQIAAIFNQQHLRLHNAKITTIGERVEDFFVISTAANQPLDEASKQQLHTALLAALDKPHTAAVG